MCFNGALTDKKFFGNFLTFKSIRNIIQYFDFTVIQEPTNITISTFVYSYGSSSRESSGGVLSVVNLFDSGGTLIGTNEDLGENTPDPNLVSGLIGSNPLFVGPLELGSYTLAMTIPEYLNSFSDTYAVGLVLCDDGIECKMQAEVKTSDWAIDLEVTRGDVTVMPLPAGLPLLAAGLVGFGILRRRQKH